MKNSHDDIESLLRSATEVPFTEDRKQKILRAAIAITEEKRPRRRPFVRSWLAAVGGVAAALVLAVSIWHVGAPEMAGHTNRDGVQSTASKTTGPNSGVPIHPGSTIGLQTAPLQVTDIGLASSKPGGPKDLVVATLYNGSNTPISKKDVVGVLGFGSGQTLGTGVMPTSDWLTFVNGPDTPLQPGQRVQWSFMPVTAPKDSKGNLIETPRLVFYDNAVKPASESNMTWQLANVTTSVTGVTVVPYGTNGQTTSLQVSVQNAGAVPVDLNRVVAVVWFTPPNSPIDFLRPDVTRFLTHVKTGGIQAVLQPGAKENLTFALTGAADKTLKNDVPHVVFANTNP